MVAKSLNTGNTKQVTTQTGLPEGMTQEQMQKLMAAFQKQKMQEMPVVKRKFMQFMQYATPKFQAAVHHIDRFINFIVKPSDADRNDVIQAARYPILFGVYVIVIFFVFGGLWAAIAPLDSASHSMGTVISSTQKKLLQHDQGGIVKAIYVKQGDQVKEGDPIIALDDTKFKANYEAALSHYRSLKAAESRLIAEKDNLPNIEFAPDLLKDAEKPEVAQIIDTQRHLFESKRELIANMEKHHKQRLEQMEKHIEGLKETKISAQKTLEFQKERLKGAQSLLAKGIIAKQALQQIEAQYAEANAQSSTKDIEIIKNEQEISKLNIEFMEKKSEILTRIIEELKNTQAELGKTKESVISYKDALDRAIITSPVDGIVNSLKVSTIGGVIGGGHEFGEISPTKDYLIVEARIEPKDIGYVTTGMQAKMRFTAFKSRTTPVFNGTVISVSPDLVVDQQRPGPTGQNAYYIAKIELDMDEFNKEAGRLNLVLLPGMQVDINIVTGTRTLMKYLLDPVTDNMFKAFKEK